MEDKTVIIIVALILVAILEMFALYLGYDGVMLAIVVGGLLYATGYTHKARIAANV